MAQLRVPIPVLRKVDAATSDAHLHIQGGLSINECYERTVYPCCADAMWGIVWRVRWCGAWVDACIIGASGNTGSCFNQALELR